MDAKEFAFEVLTLTAMFPNDVCDMIYWRVDGKYAPITFLVDCSDVFDWASADSEPLRPEDLDEFKRAIADVTAASTVPAYREAYYGCYLYCARKRKRLPMQEVMTHVPLSLVPLFAAAARSR